MTKDHANYQAWADAIPIDSIKNRPPEVLLLLARYAVLAPSGHNTQPWILEPFGDALRVRPNQARTLSYLPDSPEPHTSLGAFCETLRLAGRGHGLVIRVEYSTGAGAVLQIAERVVPEPDLLTAIVDRRSNRWHYRHQAIDPAVLEAIADDRDLSASILAITDRAGIGFVAESTREASLSILRDHGFRHELSRWVRNNWTRKHDGMPGFTQGIPTPPSFFASALVGSGVTRRTQARKDAERVRSSAALALLLAGSTVPEALFDVGALYARIAIHAARHGIATSGAAAACLVHQTRESLVEQFALPGRPVALLRLGYPTRSARPSPRWPVELVSNQS